MLLVYDSAPPPPPPAPAEAPLEHPPPPPPAAIAIPAIDVIPLGTLIEYDVCVLTVAPGWLYNVTPPDNEVFFGIAHRKACDNNILCQSYKGAIYGTVHFP
jgi:hypothetical protein